MPNALSIHVETIVCEELPEPFCVLEEFEPANLILDVITIELSHGTS